MSDVILQVVDSHTGGEPTRIIISGGPDLGTGPLSERLRLLREQHDGYRSAVINEPRGSDVLVGGLLCEPYDRSCDVGILFFNNAGYLHMCGHGTIGLMSTLYWLGRARPGVTRVETPVGIVEAELLDANRVRLRNVPSWRYRSGVSVVLSNGDEVSGDIAWGGNWFYLVTRHGRALELREWQGLSAYALEIRAALERAGITGAGGGLIDHIELFGPASSGLADSRNFVMCPGGAYDRSPCGTGTSAKLACLAADGRLAAGAVWRQESIVGSVFEGSWQLASESEAARALSVLAAGESAAGPVVLPTITGSAWVTGESRLILQESDPFCFGIRSI
ncbi:MAG: proline racemase family protein [Planctomyces sp.]|jgi:4-hydroxyproline epimerase|nr:proline racemase family protein [Planctomyces sp.]